MAVYIGAGDQTESIVYWPDLRGEAWKHPSVMIGGSDAGAHLDMMSGASYSTFVVGDAVRNGYLSIEEAVHAVTGKHAAFFGLGAYAAVRLADARQLEPRLLAALPFRMTHAQQRVLADSAQGLSENETVLALG